MHAETIYNSINEKLRFDPLDFDQELIELPMLIMQAAEMTAAVVAARDQAKNLLETEQAEAAEWLRNNLIADGKGGHKQRSEAQISSETPLYKSVQDAQSVLEKIKYDLAVWQGMCDSLRTKRDSMKIYAELIIAGYLSPATAIGQRHADIRAASQRSINS